MWIYYDPILEKLTHTYIFTHIPFICVHMYNVENGWLYTRMFTCTKGWGRVYGYGKIRVEQKWVQSHTQLLKILRAKLCRLGEETKGGALQSSDFCSVRSLWSPHGQHQRTARQGQPPDVTPLCGRMRCRFELPCRDSACPFSLPREITCSFKLCILKVR